MKSAGPGDSLIDALRDPGAYSHPVATPVRVVETHVSWILLTGPYAYKIKKPLKLSFLDYSTVARRARFCGEELRLNRRLAPELYVDVVPIGGTPAAPRVGDTRGPALEYAVRMIQFDTREELDVLIEANAVATAEIATLGARLAQFHATAAQTPPGESYGSATAVHRVTVDNFAELVALAAATGASEALEPLRRIIESERDAAEPLLDARRAGGSVRECHGDLHCANVVRWNGLLTPFDGIEFDPALRYVDVVSDIAFLAMDLGARGRPDLRHALLNAWTEGLGDYAGIAVLPYFETYRALVRGKVALLRARQHGATDAAAAGVPPDAARYLHWAAAHEHKPAPLLIITCGLSGSGKTWLARQLAAAWPALHLRSDVERKRLAGLLPLADSRSAPDGGLYSREFNATTYRRLADCARGCLLGRESVIVDAASLRRTERRDLLAVGAAAGACAAILHCEAPREVLRQRVASRLAARNDASEADVALLDRQPSYWEPLGEDERALAIVVDTTSPDAYPDTLQRLRRFVARAAR
jgi:aminoglycoside phosphotransferase family enzyme/predicted kinase